MPTIEDAIILAADAHRGQVDKLGQPYILHPLEVMSRLGSDPQRPNQGQLQIVAVLHDVIEDTEITLEGLQAAGYEPEIIEALNALTRRSPEETYETFIERLSTNALARRVKLADLDHNQSRLMFLPDYEARESLGERYHKAWVFLSAIEYP